MVCRERDYAIPPQLSSDVSPPTQVHSIFWYVKDDFFVLRVLREVWVLLVG